VFVSLVERGNSLVCVCYVRFDLNTKEEKWKYSLVTRKSDHTYTHIHIHTHMQASKESTSYDEIKPIRI